MKQIATDQKWYHLGTILSSPFSLPMALSSHKIAESYGRESTFYSIIVGNLLLWLLALTIISMTKNRSNAIGNIRAYLGPVGTILVWGVLFVSLLNWYAYQINISLPLITLILHIKNFYAVLFSGLGVSALACFFSIWGIKMLQKWALYTFPIVLTYYVYSIFFSEVSLSFDPPFSLSFPAVLSSMMLFLPGMINLPTLFRHSHSKADSYLGLSVLMFMICFFEIASIWIDFVPRIFHESSFFSIYSFLFGLMTLTAMLLVNIYYGAGLWENYMPSLDQKKGVLLFGALATVYFIFSNFYELLSFISDLMNSFLICLGVVLLIAKLLETIIQHRPRKYEALLNLVCWLSGCIASAIFIFMGEKSINKIMTVGPATSASLFLAVLFIEENIWSSKKVLNKI